MNGRLEGRYTLTANWTAAINDGTSFTATVAAGNYFAGELVAAFLAALEGGSAASYTITKAWDEAGTGKLTIGCSATVSITWTSTDLRDALGYTGNLSGAASYASPNCCDGVWLPDSPMDARYGLGDPGHRETDKRQTVSKSGKVKTLLGTGQRTRQPPLRWSHVSKARARADAETNSVMSYERWAKNTQLAALGYFPTGAPTRIWWDAGESLSYNDYQLVGITGTEMERADPNYDGLFDVRLPGGYLV